MILLFLELQVKKQIIVLIEEMRSFEVTIHYVFVERVFYHVIGSFTPRTKGNICSPLAWMYILNI
jgi:hypothetical protein